VFRSNQAITVTTRLPRPGEVSGEDYHFVSPERFAEMNRAGVLIECAETYTESYGFHVPSWLGRAIGLSSSQVAVPSLFGSGFQTPLAFLSSRIGGSRAARILERNCPNTSMRRWLRAGSCRILSIRPSLSERDFDEPGSD